MSDLRRKALGGSKTISRKAQSRQSSAASSRANSRTNSRTTSRAVSRAGSDEEEGGDLSDETNFSLGSVDELAMLDDMEEGTGAWQDELGDRMMQITERKKTSFASREEAFSAYIRILCAKYAKEEIYLKKKDLIDSMLRSVKNGRTEKESLLASKALAVTIMTDPTDDLFSTLSATFKRTIIDTPHLPLKTSLLHTLGTATFYGGASLSSTEEVMGFLLEIIESDGHSIGAGDDGAVVTAALEEWGSLCTQLDDAEGVTTDSIDALVEQLDSSEISVQIAAGENIALLYEKSYTEAEDDELDDPNEAGKKFVRRYEPYARFDHLKETLSCLSSGSKKYLSKKNRKTQHSAFADILHSVENPLKGPRYSEALDKKDRVRGSRMTVRVHQEGVLRVDRWWKLHRLQHLRRVLAGGFLNHWVENPVIFESLRYVEIEMNMRASTGAKKWKW